MLKIIEVTLDQSRLLQQMIIRLDNIRAITSVEEYKVKFSNGMKEILGEELATEMEKAGQLMPGIRFHFNLVTDREPKRQILDSPLPPPPPILPRFEPQ